MDLYELLCADWQAMNLEIRTPSAKDLLSFFLLNYSFRIITRMRIAHMLGKRKGVFRIISVLFYWMNLRRGVDIHRKAEIGPGLRLPHPFGIVIGLDVKIGKFAHILQGTTLGGTGGKFQECSGTVQTMPRLEDFVLIGSGAAVLGPIHLGNHAHVGANAVVLNNVGHETIAIGIPARNREEKGIRSPLGKLFVPNRQL